jgi:cobalamin biosynthesis protein CobT
MDYDVKIEAGEGIRSSHGVYNAEKLIKMYLLKVQEFNYVDLLRQDQIEEKPYYGLGKTKKYDVLRLDHEGVFNSILSHDKELAPLFENYREDILASYIKMEVPDEEEGSGKGDKGEEGEGEGKGKGEGDGEGEGEGKGKGKGEGEGEGDGDGEGEGDGDGEGDEEGDGDGNSSSSGNSPGETSGSSALKDAVNKMSKYEPYKGGNLSKFEEKAKFTSLPESGRKIKYKFTNEEIKNGELLIKMLDIDFEPKDDIVKSLRLGRLDTSKIAEVPAGNLSVYQQVLEDQDTQPFSVCILADMSGSMGGNRVVVQKQVMNSLYLAMSQILPAEKLYIYGHSGEYKPEIYTFYSPYDTDYEKNIQSYDSINLAQNYDGPVVEEVHRKIRETNDDRIIFITLSDGEPCGNGYGSFEDIADLKRVLEKCRRDSFVTVGIGIQTPHVKNLYTYSQVVDDLSEMSKDVANIINKVVRAEFK